MFSAAYTQRVTTGPTKPAESPSKRLGQFIRDRRLQLRLTQTELGERASMNPVSISTLETGSQGPPRKATRQRLESALAWEPGAITHVLAGGDPESYARQLPPAPEPVVDTKGLGRAIRMRRTQLQLTQDQLAAKSGLNAVSISLMENGRQGPPQPRTIARLEENLKWKPGAIEQILSGEDPAQFADDPPSAGEISVDLARSIIHAVSQVRTDLPGQPQLAASLITMLEETEGKLTLLVEQSFTREALQALMEVNALRKELLNEIGDATG
ncbi:hypothetical protein B7435_07240 [Mycolicibacterium peregrinum]|nr:hypothetical protein B7435_07240 [Mycolicibacterium peregrinum]